MIEPIYLDGGVVAEPELRFTNKGHAVCTFRIAASDFRYNQNTQEWETVRSRYLTVTIWDEQAGEYRQHPKSWANAASALVKGQKVVVHGKLHTRVWETKEGEKRSTMELLADSFYVLPDLESNVANAPQSSPAQGAWSQAAAQQQPNQAQQQWNNATQQGQTATSGAWSQPPAQTGGFGEGEAGPPF